MTSVKYVFVIICTSLSSAVFSQDKIYLEDDIRQGKITEASAVEIKYIPAEKTSLTLILPVYKVYILFNGKGDFLVPSGIDTADQHTKELLRHFLAADNNHPPKDQLFTLQKSRIEATITKEDDHYIYLLDTAKLDKKNVVAVIYKNGQPRIYGSVKMAASVMGEMQQTMLRSAPPIPSVTTSTTTTPALQSSTTTTPALQNPPAPKTTAPPVSTAASTVPTVTPASSTTPSSKTPPVQISTASSTQTVAAPTGNTTAAAPPPAPHTASDTASSTFEKLAGNISKKEFEEKAENKTKQFTDYLKILCDKTAGFEDINKAINQAISLFVNENAIVETSSINNNNVSRLNIRSYLLKVKRIQYDKIEISWANVQYVSDLKPGPDGNFYGEVTFEQSFKGYRDGKLVYSDITRKNATVVLKTYKKSIEGSTKSVWDVLLSDIGVVATKS